VKVLVIANDPPYARQREDTEVRVFPMGDAVGCAPAGQTLPDGYYHRDRMLASALLRGAQVGLCGTCMDARALHDEQLVEGARRSSLEDLTDWTCWADKVITF
jgi:uncharacterized protein involved in oxidation of intracellular sulfur